MAEDQDALRRLEERVDSLEAQLSELRARIWLAVPTPQNRPAAPPPTAAPAAARETTAPAWQPQAPGSPKAISKLPRFTQSDFEQWFGQRGLLAVGVIALVAAGAYFLKYAFDRDWIAPWLRVLGALAAGAGVALFGEQQIRRGLRRYGAAIIGAGGGLAYLGLWAAAGPYALIPTEVGSPLLALLTAVVAWRAVVHRTEALAGFAIAGAFLAPVLLPTQAPSLVRFLLYLEVVGVGAAELALLTGWSSAFTLALGGYFALPVVLAGEHLDAPIGAWHALLGGAGTILVTSKRRWPVLRLAGVLGAWGTLMLVTSSNAVRMDPVALGAATALALVAWSRDRREAFATAVLPVPPRQAHELAVLLSPLLFCLVAGASPAVPPALAIAALAALYLGSGWVPRAAILVATGCALLAIAIAHAWDGPPVTFGWMALALAAVIADRQRTQAGLRPVAVALAWLAAVHLMLGLEPLSWASATAFTEVWALTLYGCVAMSAAAAWYWRHEPVAPGGKATAVRADALWLLAGTLLFAGVSVSIERYFTAQAGPGAVLAGRLTLSLWWLVFAAVAVVLGFVVNRREVRTIGLVVAGATAVKIGWYDLSMLEALYRVAALFGLALVALAVAWLYSRRARTVSQPA